MTVSSQPRFTRLANFGGRFLPTESLWSIISKVCWANSISGWTASRLLRSPVRTGNLLFEMDPGSVSEVLGISRGAVESAMALRVSDAFSQSRLQEFAYSNLSYCPACMKERGFHSYLFQFPLFTCCPVHEAVELRSTCPSCDKMIPLRLDQIGGAFACPWCQHKLWNPRRRREVDGPDYAVFHDCERWAALWIENFVRFSGNLACLREWMSRHVDDRWTRQGIPEMEGFFSVRALWGDDDYWGGRLVIKAATDESAWVRIYVGCLAETLQAMGKGAGFFRDAVIGHQAGRVLSAEDWALCVWRCFWEGAGVLPDLLRDDAEASASSARRTAKEYFSRYLAPSGFGPLKGAVDSIVFRELLRSTFVRTLKFIRKNRDSTYLAAADEIRGALGPVFLFKPTDGGVVLEWIHQPELSKIGKRVFGS